MVMEKISQSWYITKFLSYLSIERSCSASTVNDYNREIARLTYYFDKNNVNLASVATSNIREYIYTAKQSRKLSQVSISKIIAIIKSYFNWLENEEIIDKNPSRKIKSLKKVNRIPRVITRSEFEIIIKAFDFMPGRIARNKVRDKLIISMLYYTGIRRAELLALNWDDLNLEKNILIIKNGKGGKDRIIPVHNNVTSLLDAYLTQRLPLKNNALFIGDYGNRLCINSLGTVIKSALKASGLANKGYSTHSFRHSFATNLILTGADIANVQRLLGHASLDTTKIYIHFNNSQLAKAIERL